MPAPASTFLLTKHCCFCYGSTACTSTYQLHACPSAHHSALNRRQQKMLVPTQEHKTPHPPSKRINRKQPISLIKTQAGISNKGQQSKTRKRGEKMVVFSCDGCGEILKKSQVDNHVLRCRQGCHAVSCVDCSVAFYGGKQMPSIAALYRVALCCLRTMCLRACVCLFVCVCVCVCVCVRRCSQGYSTYYQVHSADTSRHAMIDT